MASKKKGILSGDATSIAPTNISFSFRYLQPDDEKYGFCHCDAGWAQRLILRLKDLSNYKREELEQNTYEKALRSHPIKWHETSRKGGFGLPKEDELVEKPWQLQISKSKGRFHGFFIGDVFYVVLIDPNHELYP